MTYSKMWIQPGAPTVYEKQAMILEAKARKEEEKAQRARARELARQARAQSDHEKALRGAARAQKRAAKQERASAAGGGGTGADGATAPKKK